MYGNLNLHFLLFSRSYVTMKSNILLWVSAACPFFCCEIFQCKHFCSYPCHKPVSWKSVKPTLPFDRIWQEICAFPAVLQEHSVCSCRARSSLWCGATFSIYWLYFNSGDLPNCDRWEGFRWNWKKISFYLHLSSTPFFSVSSVQIGLIRRLFDGFWA